MGEWTQVEGKHNSKRASVKTIVKDVLEGEDWIFEYQSGGEFSFRFEHSGSQAVKSIEKIIARFKEFDKKAWIEINAQVIFN